MPVDPSKKTPLQIQEIPAGQSPAQLQDLLNDRIRAINDALKSYVQNPALGPVDLGTQQIVNLADPKNDLDGVNLRTLKKFGGQAVQQTVTGTGSGNAPYAIYFAFDGFPDDGTLSPIATINQQRDGRSPVIVSFTCTGAGSTDVTGNMIIDGVKLLSEDLTIPAGQLGPVYSQKIALAAALRIGQGVRAEIVLSGGCAQPTLELVLA
jgi:hypothetical protein